LNRGDSQAIYVRETYLPRDKLFSEVFGVEPFRRCYPPFPERSQFNVIALPHYNRILRFLPFPTLEDISEGSL